MSFKTDLLLKELDLIDTTISRLDAQIQKGKNFCQLVWLGVLGILLSEGFIKLSSRGLCISIALTALIPVLFWVMDFYWRKVLLATSWRQKILSLYANTKNIEVVDHDFPVLDPVSFIFKEDDYPEYIVNHRYFTPKPTTLDAVFYKEAKWFFPALTLFSLVLAIVLFYGSS